MGVEPLVVFALNSYSKVKFQSFFDSVWISWFSENFFGFALTNLIDGGQNMTLIVGDRVLIVDFNQLGLLAHDQSGRVENCGGVVHFCNLV